ncbi:MAG: glycosyltransferase [Methanomassiliicoccales archaeon]
MNVLNINDYDLENQRFNGFDIKEGLKQYGIDSRFIVYKKRSDDPAVKSIGKGFHRTALRFSIKMFERCLGIQNVLHPYVVKILIDDWYARSDIVHFHLVHNELISLLAIPKIAREKKLIWTVHDPWIVTGHCIHPMDCQKWKIGCPRCDRLRSPKITYIDMANRMCRLKEKVVQGSNIHFVVASEWMKDVLMKSPVTRGKDITVIPFGIDTASFEKVDKVASRKRFDIPEGAVVVAFRSDPGLFKGTKQAVEALSSSGLGKDVVALTFGKKGQTGALSSRYRVIDLGWVFEEDMRAVLGAADIFVMPSIAESFGMMAIEAMASGVPVIAFKGTALGEIVIDGVTGRLVEHGDVDGLRLAMEELAADPSLRKKMGDNARRSAIERYDLARQTRETAELYRRVMGVDQRL